MMKGFEFQEMLSNEFSRLGTAGDELVFLTEDGEYTVMDIRRDGGRTMVLLLEAGK